MRHLKQGQSILEFTVFFTVIIVVLITMFPYLRNAMNGKIREAGDTFGRGEQYDVNKTVKIESLVTAPAMATNVTLGVTSDVPITVPDTSTTVPNVSIPNTTPVSVETPVSEPPVAHTEPFTTLEPVTINTSPGTDYKPPVSIPKIPKIKR